MKFILKRITFLAIILPLFVFLACSDDDDNGNVIEGTNSIVDYLNNNDQYSLFAQAVDQAGLNGRLNGNAGTYTFFAPPNTAMEVFLQETQFDSIGDMSQEQALQLVSNHLLESLNFKDNFSTGYLKTLATVPVNDSVTINMSLFVDAIDEPIFNGETKITNADIEVDNGVFHEIDKVLKQPNLKTFLLADENLTTFYNAITEADITTDFETILTDTSTYTSIFVPNQNAIDDFLQNTSNDVDRLDNIYRNHFLEGLQISTDFETGFGATQATENYTGNDNPIDAYFNTQLGLIVNGSAQVVIPDIVAINGVIHVTDNIVELPSLATFIGANSNMNTFTEALNRDDQAMQNYIDRLSEEDIGATEAPYTVFGPDDNAFEELLLELYPDNQTADLATIPQDSLTNILNLHIIKETSLISDNFTNTSLESLGATVQLNASDSTLVDMNSRSAKISPLNGQATNGILHGLKSVLLP
ncbi:fasciclin domain-containing protein [Mesonia aquimarina]|uniref:fasciclin domain-containing protein n=1 Tax=Mesonia aquimarina TaxID=1504967 RepID=UPI0013CF3D69|nr:fasciclin domain-containing protein [Mesonia aquimarina]